MERYLKKWKEYQLNEAMAGMSKKERDRVHRARAISKKVKQATGATDEIVAGHKELTKLAHGVMEEEDIEEANYNHDPKTGHFSDSSKGNVYSLSKKATDKLGIDPSYIGKGVHTGNKDKDGKPKKRVKFGMPTQCGRRSAPDGKDISPKKSCSRFPKKYGSVDEGETVLEGELEQQAAYISKRVDMEVKKQLDQLRKRTGCSLQDLLRSLDAFSRASKGSLTKKKVK